jgi:hypothetical protein
MRWIDLLLVGGAISNELYHAVDFNLLDVVLDGFESI